MRRWMMHRMPRVSRLVEGAKIAARSNDAVVKVNGFLGCRAVGMVEYIPEKGIQIGWNRLDMELWRTTLSDAIRLRGNLL